MIYHEMGHLLYGSKEHFCDLYAFTHSLYHGVSPFLCYAAIRAYMPEHYNYRVVEMGKNLLKYNELVNDANG